MIINVIKINVIKINVIKINKTRIVFLLQVKYFNVQEQ
jgi:hypothetical protein